MPSVDHSTIKEMFIGGKEVSFISLGGLTQWYKPYESMIHTATGTRTVDIPVWVNVIGYAIIGGGGGGQSGNGTSNSAGRPGGASQWETGFIFLDTPTSNYTYRMQTTVGSGGAGGGNSDHSAGHNGGDSRIVLITRSSSGGEATVIGKSASVSGGKGGPESGLGVGAISGEPSIKTSPRSEHWLPVGASAAKERTGGSPGAGGGYGGGGYFGSRGTGSPGGSGQVRLYLYSV